MLHLSWHLPGYQPDDTPPGGALILRARAVSCADPRTDAKRESAHLGRAARRAGRRGCRLWIRIRRRRLPLENLFSVAAQSHRPSIRVGRNNF